MWHIKNINKGWITSLVGYLIIFACLVSVIFKGGTWADAALGMVVGVGLLGARDPNQPGSGATGVVGVLVLALAFGGCASFEKLQNKYGTQAPPTTVAVSDSVKVPVTVTTKADSLSTAMSMDSLAAAPVGDTIHLVSAGGLAKVSIWKSAPKVPGGSQQLHANVKVPPQIIHDTVTKWVTLYGQCPPAWTFAPTPKTPWYQPYWSYYQHLSTWAFSAFLLVLAIMLGTKMKPRLLMLLLASAVALGSAGGLASCVTQEVGQGKFRPQPLPKKIYRNLHH